MRLYTFSFGCVAFLMAAVPICLQQRPVATQLSAPSFESEVALPSFVSAARFAQFDEASKASGLSSGVRIAAEELSTKFFLADRSDAQFLAVANTRDMGPPLSAGEDTSPSQEVSVVDLGDGAPEDDPPKQLRTREKKSYSGEHSSVLRVQHKIRRSRSGLQRTAALPDTKMKTGITLRQIGDDIDPPDSQATAMQPMLAKCGKMTPACLNNEAWCGC